MRVSLLLILLSFTSLYGQTDALKNIRSHYTEVKKMIETTKDQTEEGSPLYCNIWKDNVYDGSWRAVGTYSREVQFWYDDVPGMDCGEVNDNEACHLQMIIHSEMNGYNAWGMEFLFDNGKLVFAYLQAEGTERRFYWENEKLFRVQVDDEVQEKISEELRSDAAEIWDEGMGFREMYIKLY